MPQEWVEESRDKNDMNKNWDGSLLDRRRSGVYPKMWMVLKVPYIAIHCHTLPYLPSSHGPYILIQMIGTA